MKAYQFFRIVEIKTKIVSVSSFGIAYLYSRYSGAEAPLGIVLLCFAAVLCVDMGTTAFNIFFDYYRGVDRAAYGREAEKVLVYEGVPSGAALLIAVGLFAAAMVMGLLLSCLRGWEIAAAGAVSMLVGFFYTGGPRPISSLPVGEFFAGFFLGTVLQGICFFIFAGRLPREALLVSLPSFFFVASILTVNNTCDIEGDRAGGRRTLSILIGPGAGEVLIYLLGAAGFGSLLLLTVFHLFPSQLFVSLALALPISVLEYRNMHIRGLRQETKEASMGSISKIFILYTLTVWLALVFSLFL